MVAVLDHQKRRTFVIRKDGLPDVGEFLLKPEKQVILMACVIFLTKLTIHITFCH